MDTIGQTTTAGGKLNGEDQRARDAALKELQHRLRDGLAKSGKNVGQLATAANLARSTVSPALSKQDKTPSAATVTALARVLRLDVDEMLQLRRKAADESTSPVPAEPESGPTGVGRPISTCDPYDLEVHPAPCPRPTRWCPRFLPWPALPTRAPPARLRSARP